MKLVYLSRCFLLLRFVNSDDPVLPFSEVKEADSVDTVKDILPDEIGLQDRPPRELSPEKDEINPFEKLLSDQVLDEAESSHTRFHHFYRPYNDRTLSQYRPFNPVGMVVRNCINSDKCCHNRLYPHVYTNIWPSVSSFDAMKWANPRRASFYCLDKEAYFENRLKGASMGPFFVECHRGWITELYTDDEIVPNVKAPMKAKCVPEDGSDKGEEEYSRFTMDTMVVKELNLATTKKPNMDVLRRICEDIEGVGIEEELTLVINLLPDSLI